MKKNTSARVSFDTKAKLEIPENRNKNGSIELPKQKRKSASIRGNPCEPLTRNYFHVSSQRAAFEVDHLRPATGNLLYEGGGGGGGGHNAQYRQHCLR